MSLTDILRKLTPEQLTFLSVAGSTYVGAFVLYMLNRLQKRQPFSLFSAMNIDIGSANARPNLGAGISAASVVVSGTESFTTQTDADGNYLFASLAPGGNFTVTPSKTPYTFVPATRPGVYDWCAGCAGTGYAA
jgi:hypothetical protein